MNSSAQSFDVLKWQGIDCDEIFPGANVLQSRSLVPVYIVPSVSGIQHNLSITCCVIIGLSYFIWTQAGWIEKLQVTRLGGTLAPEGELPLLIAPMSSSTIGNTNVVGSSVTRPKQIAINTKDDCRRNCVAFVVKLKEICVR